MKNMAFGIGINLGIKGLANIAKINTSFDKLKIVVKNSDTNVKNLTKSLASYRLNLQNINNLKQKQEDLKSQIFNIKNLATSGAMAFPVKLAIDFESAMSDVKKVVDFSNKDEQKLFENSILKLSEEIPLAATQLVSIAAAGGQMGIAKNELLEFTKITAKMSTAFEMSAENAGDSIAKLMNVYRLNILEANLLGDAINHLSDTSASNAREIVEVMQRIGGSAKVFGLTQQQAAALSSTFLALGKRPETAATSIEALLNKLSTATTQGEAFQEVLQKMGIDAEYLKSAIEENPQVALETFLKQLQKIDKKHQMDAFTAIVGQGFAGDLALLVGNLEQYNKALSNVSEEVKYASSMENEFREKSKITASNITLFKNSLSSVGITIGNVLLPPLNSVLLGLSSGISLVNDFMKKNQVLTKAVVLVSAGFFALKIAILSLSLVKTILSIKILSLRNAFLALNIQTLTNFKTTTVYTRGLKIFTAVITLSKIALGFLLKSIRLVTLALSTNPIGLILTGIALIAGLIIYNWDTVKKYFFKFINWIKPIFKPVLNTFKLVWNAFFDFIADKFDFIKGIIDKTIGWINTAILKAKELIADVTEFFSSNESQAVVDYQSDHKVTALPKNDYNYLFGSKESATSLDNSNSITINFNGDMLMQGKDGKISMDDFKKEIIKATKNSIKTDVKNSTNRRIFE